MDKVTTKAPGKAAIKPPVRVGGTVLIKRDGDVWAEATVENIWSSRLEFFAKLNDGPGVWLSFHQEGYTFKVAE